MVPFASTSGNSTEYFPPTGIVTTSCNQSTPLTLVQVTESQEDFGSGPVPTLHFKWANCSSQNIKFAMTGGTVLCVCLRVTVETFGNTTTIDAILAGGNTVAYPVDAQSQTTVNEPINFYRQSISPNATVLRVSGNVTASDPVTGQQISQLVSFQT